MSLVKDINNDPSSTSLAGLAQIGNTLFISANDITHGYELWKTDGTTAGTALVKDIIPGADSGFPYSLGVVNDRLFFEADDGTNSGNTEIWVSDGTEAGTQMVMDIFPGDDGGTPPTPHSSAPGPEIEFDNFLYFTAIDGIHGAELWRTNGTTTELVKDIYPGGSSGLSNTDAPFCFAIINGGLFFGARDADHGMELWKTDGTESGTNLFMDINPGAGDSDPCDFVQNNGIAYFIADDGDGEELWQTDGTPAGAFRITNLNGPGGTIYSLHQLNGNLYFFWDDGVHGEELWQAVPPQPTTTTITADTPDPSYPNQSVSVSVTVSGPLATPTGTVDITGADTNCQITLSAGTGSCNVVFSTPGKKTLTATYNGDSTSLTSAATEIHQVIETKTFRSIGAQDGWVLESGENTNAGGTMDASATTFRLGDETANKQYRAILSFNTASLPDTATITKVTLKIKKQGQTGTNPFTILGALRIAIANPFFGASAGLANSDFQAAANINNIGSIPNSPVSNWYSKTWTSGAFFAQINRTGITQFRLRFQTDDNNNSIADFISFFSGDAPLASRPQLIIEYHLP